MTVAYAPKGLLGLFTPQANTTVEPEMALLTRPGLSWINARMMSDKDTISARLLDYMSQFPGLLAQFANAPVDAIAIGCTGASYLLGTDREDALLADIECRTGRPAFSGASASVDALNRLGARRIALVTPYNSALDAESASYWVARGFDVVAERSAFRETTEFHPIYSLGAEASLKASADLEESGADAVLMLGTGMPTLDAILARPRIGNAPVLSCMLCLGWKFAALRDPAIDSAEGIMSFVNADFWGDQLRRIRRASTEPSEQSGVPA